MWKLLPVCLLLSCATNDQQQAGDDGSQSHQGSIVRQFELPLEASEENAVDQPARKNFRRSGMQGWLDDAGTWQLKGEVHHGRLRCASYALGVQPGRGEPACSEVVWLSEVEYAPRLTHCNSASRLHEGSGEFPDMVNRLEEVTCVRVVIRCEGSC